MASRVSAKSLVIDWIDSARPARIDRDAWNALQCRLAAAGKSVSTNYLLELLLGTELDVDRSVGGIPADLRDRVHTSDPEAAAQSLVELSAEYALARRSGDRGRAEDCRRAVRRGKDRLRLQLRRKNLSAEQRAVKNETLRWFLLWLETPELFPDWLAVRRSSASPSG